MSRTLTPDERADLLAGVHVGVLSVASPDPARGPLAVPIWYSFDPDVGISVITDQGSRKGRAIEAAGRFGMVVQRETMPYRYVSVEGPVVASRLVDADRDFVPMATRYFGEHLGPLYAASMSGAESTTLLYTMAPERWYSYSED